MEPKKPNTKKTKVSAAGEKKTVKYSFASKKNEADNLSTEALTGALRSTMGMKKSVKALKVKKEVREKVAESKVAFGLRNYRNTTDNVEVKSYQRLSDAELRQLAQLDPYVSAIIATRTSQAASCGTPSESKFKKGLRVMDLNPPQRTTYTDEDKFHSDILARGKKMKAIETWILNCGTSDEEILDSAFARSDRDFKHCTFRQFIEAQVRNLLTFGRCATQVFRDQSNTPVMFRPIPVETIAPVIDREEVSLSRRDEVANESLSDADAYNALRPFERPAAWVQRIDGQNANFFTEDDLKIWYHQKQALFELNGYPLAPMEQAVFMVFIHQQTLSYLKNQYVKGMGTKGIVNLVSTNENVQLSDADIEDFKQQFHNFVSRTDNSAVTPVVGGPVEVKFIPLATNPKDMEFLQTEEHVIRALCSAFQISPQEMGYGNLSLPQGGLSSGNKQEEIIRGEERGLRNLLDIVYEGVNEILFENFPEAKGMFKVSYVGVGEDTRDAVIQRQTVEINTTATMNSLFADSEKKDAIPIGGAVPLAPIFHANVVRYLFYWEFRKFFLGDKEAENNPAFKFIIDTNLNQAYQGLAVQPIEMQQEQAKIGLEQQEEQGDQLKQQGEMMKQQAAAPPPAEAPQEGGEQQAPEPEQKSEPAPRTLKEKYLAKSREQKTSSDTMSSYFREWLASNNYAVP